MAIRTQPTIQDGECFWMVWADRGQMPTFKHATEESASAEAERLSSRIPGVRFYVLRATEEWLRLKPAEKRILREPLPF